ncbi:MAG: thiamine pyrophosphate-dependent enzyme, partial [Rhodospirillaceae bacterium]|nr:thiamine pyrophosphate-dependent enzyme [Rhodospirillaceae bacterium]
RKDGADAIAFRESGLSAAGDKMPSWTLCEGVQRVLDRADDPILISDGGEFGQWAQAMVSAPTRVINGPSGAIGGGICYAIAAKLARPEATVIALMGDGTAGFHFSEFDTAVRAGAAIVAVIGNDARWNAEHLIQMRDYGEQRLIGCELNQTRYDLAAAGLGCVGEYVTSEDQLTGALERAVSGGQPACVNVEIEGFGAPNFVRG